MINIRTAIYDGLLNDRSLTQDIIYEKDITRGVNCPLQTTIIEHRHALIVLDTLTISDIQKSIKHNNLTKYLSIISLSCGVDGYSQTMQHTNDVDDALEHGRIVREPFDLSDFQSLLQQQASGIYYRFPSQDITATLLGQTMVERAILDMRSYYGGDKGLVLVHAQQLPDVIHALNTYHTDHTDPSDQRSLMVYSDYEISRRNTDTIYAIRHASQILLITDQSSHDGESRYDQLHKHKKKGEITILSPQYSHIQTLINVYHKEQAHYDIESIITYL